MEKIRKVFPSFDPAKLKSADFKMWQKIRGGEAAAKNYEKYREAVLKAEGWHYASITKSSRLMFAYFLGDWVQNKLLLEEPKEKD